MAAGSTRARQIIRPDLTGLPKVGAFSYALPACGLQQKVARTMLFSVAELIDWGIELELLSEAALSRPGLKSISIDIVIIDKR